MGKPASVAVALLVFAAVAAGTLGHSQAPPLSPQVRDPVVSCGNVDYVFALNLQRKDHAENPAAFQQLLQEFIQQARLMTESGDIGVGLVAFSGRVEFRLPVSRNLTLVDGLVQRFLAWSPSRDGVATGDALLAAKKLLARHRFRLAELGVRNRRLVVVAAVAGDRTKGMPTFAASTQLRKVASHVFAVNLAGGASPKELYRIASDGTRGIFDASTIVDAATRTEQYAQVFCPCPLAWTDYQNCTIRGQAQVERFFYNRARELTHDCVRNSTINFEPCDCPPNRVERSACVNGFIRISTYVYTRPDNSSDCVEAVTDRTEACGRATGCESLVCPSGSQCVTDGNNTVRCNCTNPNDVFKVSGCERCGDREPVTSRGPCINGQRAVMVMTFTRINDTNCMVVNNRSIESCSGCPVNNTRLVGPCVRGYQQVTLTVYQLRDGRCFKNLVTRQRACRLTSEYQCVGSVMGGGQFVTYDGQRIDFPGPCNYLLTERLGQFQVHVQHAVKYPTLPYLTEVHSASVIIGNVSYELRHDLVFLVSGTVQPLPYSDAGNSVEAIYSDDSLVFAAGDQLYVQMRRTAATVSVRSGGTDAISGQPLRGILGNCNGNRTDDFIDRSSVDVSERTDRDTALGTSFQLTVCVTTPCCPVPTPPACGTNASLQAVGVANCGHLAADAATSPFAHCGEAAMRPMLQACVALYCRAQDNPAWQRSLICGTMEAAAFRCFLQVAVNRSSYPVFRSPGFCPKSCGHNAEFVYNSDFCPRTCARHFFSAQSLGCATPFGYQSRNANGQAPVPGCQCRSGFVLDGNNCVPPNQCECLSNLCIDRENRSVCEAWKAQGYCAKYPLQMRRYCRLTCEQCRAPCQDQIDKVTCRTVKAEGRCGDSFYSQMCQLTCNPTDCECPPCKTVRGPCDTQYQNRQVSRYCFAPDATTGRCQRSLVSTVYEACGVCQTDQRSIDTRACDYCTQEQVTRFVRSVRETSGEMRCVQVSGNMTTRSDGCGCQANSSRTVCYRNSELFRITTVSGASADCATCQTNVTESRVRNVTCTTVVQRGPCDRAVTKRRRVTVTRGLVRNCQCDSITEEFEEMCVCPRPHWTPLTCHKNREMLRWFAAFSLVHGRCVAVVTPHRQAVPCHRRARTRYSCRGCVRLRQRVWFERTNCRCVRRHKERRVGLCCCPKPTTVRSSCVGGQRSVTVTRYTRENFECQPVTQVVQERCGCPPSRPIRECDSETGSVTIGKLIYRLIDGTCEEVRQVKTVPTKCKKLRIKRRTSCRLLTPDAIVKHRRVLYEVWHRVDGTCRCRRERRVKQVACGCRDPQVRDSKCPADCPATSVNCPDHCHRTRAVVEYRMADGQCHPEERDQRDLPCCCEKPHVGPPVCENERVLARRKFHVHLVGEACSLKEHVVRTDVARHCDLTQVRRERHGDLVIVKRRVIHNCRCVWRSRRSRCPERCPPPSRIVRCDGATGERLMIERHHRLHACRCLPRKRIRRLPVDCPEPRIERENLCSSEEPAVLVKRINFYVDKECQCRERVVVKKFGCEREVCEEAPRVRLVCEGNQLFNVVTFHKRDEEGTCAPMERRHEVETPRCRGHSKKKKQQFKKCIEGKLVQFSRWLQMHKCRCQTKYHKRVLGSCTKFCERRNHHHHQNHHGHHGSRIRRQCVKETNQLVTFRLKWRFHNGRCVRKWMATQKRTEPECPRPRVRRLPCDHETGKQRLELHHYVMHHCRCRGPKVRVTYRKCSCRRPKVLGRYCDARRGRMVVRIRKYSWNFHLNACHTKLVRKYIPIPCRHHNRERHGPCVHGHMRFQRVRYIRDRRSCRCHRKVQVKKVNCHCPVVIRRGKCHGHRRVAVTTVIYRKFDAKKRRCVVENRRHRRHRCRCPKRRQSRSCVDGQTRVSTVAYRMVNGHCEADRSEETVAVVCTKPLVIRTTKCNRHTCRRRILTYRWQADPQNCRCRLHLVNKKSCRCCGCPKPHMRRRCIGGRVWSLETVVHSLRLKTCSHTCRRRVRYRTERVRCSSRRRVHWTRCHRCRSRKVITSYRSIGCRCHRRLHRMNDFRACCCRGGTRLRRRCQQSTGLWMTLVKRQVLSHHRCIWHSKIRYLPRPVCQLPQTPVVYGVCDRSTCQQNVTNIQNVLNKQTCSCHLVNVPAGTRTCCCLNTTATTTYNCIGDNTLQRITVAPVFNETTHTCVSVTSIDVQVVSCGDGETRSSDPPCIGDTRTIVSTRAVPINCQCVNQTVSTRSELCVCPPASNWTTQCDSSTGELVSTQQVYTLVNGSCPATTRTERRSVTCDTTPRSVPVCNNDTCVETVTTTVQELNRASCSCVSRSSITTQMCCCPTTVQTRSECTAENQFETVATRQVLDPVTRSCQPQETRTRAGDVPCVNETRQDMGCDPATRNRTILVTRRGVINCQCQAVGTAIVRQLCACPPERSFQGACNKATCMRRITRVQFNPVTAENGTLQCVKAISYSNIRCCCTPLGQKRVRVHVQCDRETGNLLVSRQWKKFIVTTRQCRAFHRSWIKEVDCSGKFDGEDRLVHRSPCNRRTGLRTLTVKWYTRDTNRCRCKLNVRRRHRICSCKHKHGKRHSYCDQETNELVHTRRFYVLQEGQCAPQEDNRRQQVTCPENRKVRESCNDCNNEKVTSYNVLRNCKCKRKRIVEKTKCCCPETKFHRKCHDGQMKITAIRFKLSSDKKTCERLESHRFKHIKCHRKHRSRHDKCNRHTCMAHVRVEQFHLSHCRCRRRVRVHKRRCCCPKPRLRTRCHRHGTMVHERIIYRLHKGHCVPNISRKRNRIRCPEPRKVGRSRCSHKTSRRVVSFRAFTLRKCRCVPKRMRHYENCACPRPRVVRQPCGRRRRHRTVFRIVYRRHHGKCRPKKKLLFKEPCRCHRPKHNKMCDPMNGHTMLEKTHTFHMTSRHGRRSCEHEEHEEPKKIHCRRRSVRRGPCRHGRRKILVTEYRVRRCRCVRRRQVRRVRCAKRKGRRRHRKTKCHKGRLIHITQVVDPETGEKRVERKVKKVVCRTRPRVVPLSKGCQPREEDGGLYRKVAIVHSVRRGCRCKQKRRVRWRLCRCKKNKKSRRCVHDIMEHSYKEEHHRHHGHCRRKRSRRIREHRCPRRSLSVKKGRCNRHNCRRQVVMRKCWMEHCRCRCRRRVGHELCCRRPPVRKRFCKGHRMHFISTRFRLKRHGILAKDSETGDEWRQMKSKAHTRHWSKRIHCPRPEVRQSCNRETGVLTKRITVYRKVHCKCRPRMRTVHARCRCPPPHTRTGHCSHGRRRLRHTKYHLGKDGHCHKRHSASWKRCGCPKPKRRVRCVRGRIHICTVKFKQHHGCRPKRHCHFKKVHCPPSRTKRTPCIRNRMKLITIQYTVNRKTCQCDRTVTVQETYCNCRQLNREKRTCHGNLWVTVRMHYRLQRGECLPDESTTHREFKCKKHRTHIVPGTCERRSGLSSSGTQIARVAFFTAVNCRCKSRVRNIRVPCVCSLIPKYRTRKSTECRSHGRLVTTVTSYHLKNGKCKPRAHKIAKAIRCHGRRTRRTACLRDDLGDRYQYLLTLRKRARHCRCRWVVVRKVRTSCGCRPPTAQRSCIGDDMWQRTVVRYTHPELGASCEPRAVITTTPVNCSEARTVMRPCNTDTCVALEVTLRFRPKHCHCHTHRSFRHLRCCCPLPVVSPEQCNATTNQFEQVTTQYNLENNTCVMTQNTTYRTVTCDTRTGETNTSVCNSTTNRRTVSVRDVSIVNCQCVSTVRTGTESCSCPDTQRVVRGQCNGTQIFTTDEYYRQVFNSTSGTCAEVLYNSVQRPCICSGVAVSIMCIGASRNIQRRVTYAEQLVNDTCVNTTIITDREITCAGNGTSQQTRSDCAPVVNTRSVTQVNYLVDNCTCIAQTTRATEPCNCFERNGGRIETSICRADNVTVRTVTYYYDGARRDCQQTNVTTEQRVTCSGHREVRLGCNRDSRKVEVRVFELVPVACRCVWSEQPVRFDDCRCRRPHSKRICEHGKRWLLTTYYQLSSRRCQKRQRRRIDPVVCNHKGRRAGVHYGRCSSVSGTRRVVKYVHRVHRCRCVTKRVRRRCPCRCPNSRTWRACKSNKIVTFEVTYKLKGCRCVKQLKTRESRAACSRHNVRRTACVRGHDGDGHLMVLRSRRRSIGCRCQIERKEQREACECQARVRQHKKCNGRTLTIVTTQRQLVRGTCRRVTVRTEARSVACPLKSVRAVSRCNRHGYRLLERVRWRAHKCRCETHVTLERQRCSMKCDKGPKIARASPCNKATCTKRLHYYYKNEKCHHQSFAVTARCCCPRSHHNKQKKCLKSAFEIRNIFHRLEHGVCVMSSITYRQEIDCPRREKFETAVSANGDTIVLKTWYAVRHCMCKKLKIKSHTQHRECRAPEVKRECISVPEHRTVHTITRYVKLTRDSDCEKEEEVTETPVICPMDILHRGPCHSDIPRRAFVRAVTTITFEKADCRCVPRRTVSHEVCRCFQTRLATRCRKTKGIIMVTKRRYDVRPDGAGCHEIKNTRLIQVNCDSTWRAPPMEERKKHRRHRRVHRQRIEGHHQEGEFSRRRRDVSNALVEAEGEDEIHGRPMEGKPSHVGHGEFVFDGVGITKHTHGHTTRRKHRHPGPRHGSHHVGHFEEEKHGHKHRHRHRHGHGHHHEEQRGKFHDEDWDNNGWDGHFSQVLEREVRVGCSCRVQRRQRSCESHCPHKSKHHVCENGLQLFRVITTYRRSGHCRCSYRVRRIPVSVRLPRNEVVHHKCRRCQQRVQIVEYRMHNCKAKRFVTWSHRRCCCRKRPRISVRCSASQMLVKQKRTERLNKHGHCVPRYTNHYQLVTCRHLIRERALTRCVNGRRVWRRELERIVKCSCLRTSKRVTRRCGFKVCKPAIVKFGPCINCASKETKTEFIYSPVTNRCEAKRFHHIHNCCCSSPRTSKRCVRDRLRLITSTYKFHTRTGKCRKSDASSDITRQAYKRCRRVERTTIGRCMVNGFRVVVNLRASLVDCACHRNQTLSFVRCRCDPPAVSEDCVRNGTTRYRRTIRQELEGTVCKNITDEVFAQVECPVGTTTEGVCDTVTCQRVITDVTYSVSNCACHRLTAQRLETCCCPPTVSDTRTCERAENIMVVTQAYQEFDLRNRACVSRTRTERIGTICAQNYRSFFSPCDQYRNNSLYRTVSESITVPSGCECVAQTTTRTELCGCDSSREYTVCTPENQLLTYRIEYRPDANNTICVENRVVLGLRDVACDGTQRADVPVCSSGTRSTVTGEVRINVVTSWMAPSNNCTCARQTRAEQVLCACPENSQPRTVCDHHRHQRLNITTVYSLLVTGSVRQCITSKVVTRLGTVHCPAPVVQLGSCQYGLMTVNTLVHKLRGCSCVPKRYRHQQRCSKKTRTPCINRLPDWLCADLDRRFGICERSFDNATANPELEQLAQASALCDKQCARCDGCQSIGGRWQFKFVGRECLVVDTRYPGLSIRTDAGFANCLHRCKANLACRSFDYYLPSGQCTLAKVNRDGLHDFLLPRHHMLGAIPMDNIHRGADRCNLYERICSLRVTTRLEEVQLGCPRSHVTSRDPHCRCQQVSLALGYYRYCYRTVTVTYFVRSPSGSCVRRSTFVRTPCGPCRDRLSPARCRAVDLLGGCSVSSSAHKCAKTCRICQCDGREFVRLGKCNRLTGRRVDTVLRTEWIAAFRMCRVVIQKVPKRCPNCSVGQKVLPQPCVGNKRLVLHIKTIQIGGRCKSTVRRQKLPCHRCHAGVAINLGPCVHGRRSVNSYFAVANRKTGVCKEQKTSYIVRCAGCPSTRVRTQPCIAGRRMRQVTYHVRLPRSRKCYEARFETEDRCGTLCHNHLSDPECSYQHRTGQCAWNLLTTRVCPRVCNRC